MTFGVYAIDKNLKKDILDDVSSVIGLHGALRFNGGGHLNHSIFWQVILFMDKFIGTSIYTYHITVIV